MFRIISIKAAAHLFKGRNESMLERIQVNAPSAIKSFVQRDAFGVREADGLKTVLGVPSCDCLTCISDNQVVISDFSNFAYDAARRAGNAHKLLESTALYMTCVAKPLELNAVERKGKAGVDI